MCACAHRAFVFYVRGMSLVRVASQMLHDNPDEMFAMECPQESVSLSGCHKRGDYR